YQGKLFDFQKQRDRNHRGWSDYAAMARRRGLELITELQEGFPSLTVLLTFGHSALWRQSDGGMKPLSECPDGLLAPFLDGMIPGVKTGTKRVDGHELSYGYRDPAAFARARQTIEQDAATLSGDPAAYKRTVSVGFGIWLDYDWQKNGWKA